MDGYRYFSSMAEALTYLLSRMQEKVGGDNGVDLGESYTLLQGFVVEENTDGAVRVKEVDGMNGAGSSKARRRKKADDTPTPTPITSTEFSTYLWDTVKDKA